MQGQGQVNWEHYRDNPVYNTCLDLFFSTLSLSQWMDLQASPSHQPRSVVKNIKDNNAMLKARLQIPGPEWSPRQSPNFKSQAQSKEEEPIICKPYVPRAGSPRNKNVPRAASPRSF